MKDPESRTTFAGVDGRTDTELPEGYRERHGNADLVTFAEAVRDLSQAVETTVAYQNPYTDEWVETERFNALAEPSRAREQTYERQLETEGDEGTQSSLAGERALASFERISDDLQSKVDQFEEREDALRERFQDAMS